jgi:mono/diheme cytochrome c family protein
MAQCMTRTLWLAAGCIALAAVAHAQDPAAPDAFADESGRATYLAHCAACHGTDGGGDGPVIRALRTRPDDLRGLAARTGPGFSRAALGAFILGRSRPPSAHGTSEMPVWGPLFRQLNTSGTRVDVRLERLLDYLESMQTPSMQTPKR